MKRIGIEEVVSALALGLTLLGSAATATAYEAELRAYWQALASICMTGVTPDHVRLYEAVVKAVEAAEYGRGRTSNFWGPRSPELAYLDCFQAPGWQ